MELTPDHFTLSLNSADRVWQMEGQCKPLSPSNGVVNIYPDPSGAQIVDFASNFIEISLPEMNRARDLNSRGFAPRMMLLEYL